MKVFVDVGSHEGQTIEEVIKPEWGFDLIFALEPMPKEFQILRRSFQGDPRVKALNIGLGAATAKVSMYGDNVLLEASLFQEKNDVDSSHITAVEIEDAREFCWELPEGADIFVNMNCEGAELPILTRLLDTGAIQRITALLVDFDIRKIAHLAEYEADLRFGLDMSGITWTCEYPLLDTHQEQIAQWLRSVL